MRVRIARFFELRRLKKKITRRAWRAFNNPDKHVARCYLHADKPGFLQYKIRHGVFVNVQLEHGKVTFPHGIEWLHHELA